MIHYGDITKISGYDVPIVDCIIGGSPCQDLSVAGKRAGLDGERSGLFMEQIRITKEMRERDERSGRTGEFIRPRFLIWENVPGAFSSNKGQDFRIVLEELAKIVQEDAVIPMPPKNKWTTSGAIVGDGWSIAWRILDAQFWGVPQRRRRIALVADFGGGCAQEVLFERKGLRGDSSESRTERESATTDAQGCVEVHDRDGKTYGFPLGFRPENVRLYDEKATTLCVGTRAGFCNGIVSLEPGIASREGGHIYEDVSGTLRANAGDNQMSVAYPVSCLFENHSQDTRYKGPLDIAPTVSATYGMGGNNQPFVVEPVKCYDIGDRRSVANESVDVAPTLLSKMGTGGNNVPVIMEQEKIDSNYLDVEMEVATRKYEVDCDSLRECLRGHKESLKLNNKRIAEQLDLSITEVEHWFRNDKYFSIPSPDVWYDLKELLGIETDEFDKSIMEFEFKGGNYDMRNRIYVGEASPTLRCDCGNSLYLVPFRKKSRAKSSDDATTWVEANVSNTLNTFDIGETRCNEVVVVMDRSAYNQGVNAKYNIGIDENGVAFSHIAKGPGAVCYIDTSHADDVVRTDEVVAPLQARDYKGGKLIAMAEEQPVICLQGNGIDRADTAGCNGKGWKEGTCYTLNTVDRPAICYKKPHYIVRRLTPLECERLQGFPDGWTDIGEYIDSKGKKKKTSDSARYKALGNSIALPPWKWVIKRLCSHYERDATMASLFDGIGGFPRIWEQINGKGSCLWASEIEDFPIAVTKVRIE